MRTDPVTILSRLLRNEARAPPAMMEREHFFEKIVEICDALNDNLRMTLSVTTQMQATFGADRYGIRPGPVGLGRIHIRNT